MTTTEFWSDSYATTTTIINSPEGTDSVIVKEPHNPTVTTTEFWSDSYATTKTITAGPLGTDSIIVHDPYEELSSSNAIESSDLYVSSSVQEPSSLIEQSLSSAEESSSMVKESSSSDIPSLSSIQVSSSELFTVSSYDSYFQTSTDTSSFLESSSSHSELALFSWSSFIDSHSSRSLDSISDTISTSQETPSSSEESSTSTTDNLVSSDTNSILSFETSSYYPSNSILPSDDFPQTIAGESDSQPSSLITSTIEISSDSASLSSDSTSSFGSSYNWNSDLSSLSSNGKSDILTSSSSSTLVVLSFSLSSTNSFSLTYPHYVNSTTYHTSQSEGSSVASPSVTNDDTHTLLASTDITSNADTDFSTMTICRRDNGDGCIVTDTSSSEIVSEQTSDVMTTSNFISFGTPASEEHSITDIPNIQSLQSSGMSSTKTSVSVTDTIVSSISLSSTSTFLSAGSIASDTDRLSTTNLGAGSITAESLHTSTTSNNELSIQVTGETPSSGHLSATFSSVSDITTGHTTVEDNEPTTFSPSSSSRSETFANDNSISTKDVGGENTIKTPPATDIATASSLLTHSAEVSIEIISESSFSKVASVPVNTETSLRSINLSSNVATESSETVKTGASAEAISSPPTSTENGLIYSTEESKVSTYPNSGSSNDQIIESQGAAQTDSVSTLTANPVATLTFGVDSSAAENESSETKSSEESNMNSDSLNETNNGINAIFSKAEVPNSFIQSDSILTMTASATDASMSGDGAALNAQPTTLVQQIATSSYNSPLISTYSESSSGTKQPSWFLKFIGIALFFSL